MSKPTHHDYLAIVSEWSGSALRGGGQVGNAYPVLNLTTGEIVTDPAEEFPNPGGIFLTSRTNLKTWDFVVLRPEVNSRYNNSTDRDCYYITVRPPTPLTQPSQLENVAVVLDHPTFDLASTARQLQNPRHNVTPIFFVQKNQVILGPLLRDLTQLSPIDDVQRIDWRPAREDGVIYEFTRDELAQKGVRIAEYDYSASRLNRVLASPILFASGPVRSVTSTKVRDALPDANLIEWYLARCPTAEITSNQLSALKTAFRAKPGDDPAIQEARLKKIEREITANIAFLEERERFAKQYLDSERGQQQVRSLIEQTVDKRASEIKVEVDRRQKELATKRDELAKELADAEAEHKRLLASLEEDRKSVKREVENLEAAATTMKEQLAFDGRQLAERMRENLPFLAVFASARPATDQSARAGGGGSLPVRRADGIRPIPPSVPVKPVEDEKKLVRDLHATLAGQGLNFAPDFVANVYVCLKSQPLNLIIGPPGYGKSMLVAALARSLGHADALFRIAVRRSWSEDRHLLGFCDSFHERYDPGPSGLVPRLIQAQLDWERDRTGVYTVLLDEFNLAAPEYYFSQLLQTLPADDPVRVVHLYDPVLGGEDGFPNRVTLTPNLRFWGTINYDETTERLSPRTLDRTGMIFLGDADVRSTAEAEPPPMAGVSAGDLFDKYFRTDEDCPESHWELVSTVIDHLRSADPALGAKIELSPRVRRAIKRYLANSTEVLDRRMAVDFVVQQRILPVVRGRGEGFIARIDRLRQLLSDANLTRSATHVTETLDRSEQQFGELDFLSY